MLSRNKVHARQQARTGKGGSGTARCSTKHALATYNCAPSDTVHWPLPAAGAPEAGPSFFCTQETLGSTGVATLCYQYSATLLTWHQARAACQASGGDLPLYKTAAGQLTVENYFAEQVGWGRREEGAQSCCWHRLLGAGRVGL
jgi:hypothetical protein